MKAHTKICFYNILYTTLIGANPFFISFSKVDRFIRIYDETKIYDEIYDAIYNRTVCQKGIIAYCISHNYAKNKIDS